MIITASDRQAAEELRALLADLSGFWHVAGDDGPLCQALARHRAESELRLLEKLQPWLPNDAERPPSADGGSRDGPEGRKRIRPPVSERASSNGTDVGYLEMPLR